MHDVHEATATTANVHEVEEVYRREGVRLWRALVGYTGSPEIADDALAEAFAQCLQRGDAVRSPAPWIWRAAFRIAAGALKERARWGEEHPDVGHDVGDAERHLVWALAQLPPRQRSAILLRYYAGFRPAEIARIIGSAAPTVRVHLMRARRRLREILEATDGED